MPQRGDWRRPHEGALLENNSRESRSSLHSVHIVSVDAVARTEYHLGMNGNAQLIRQLRSARGLTQRALASAVGVSRQLVAAWESGILRVSEIHRPRLAAKLETTVEELVRRNPAVPSFDDIPDMRKARRARPHLPIGATIDQMLRLGPMAERVHREARRVLTEEAYRDLCDYFPRMTPEELLAVFILVVMGARPVWTSPRQFRCPMVILDDFANEYGGDQMQRALLWRGDGEWMVVFAQLRARAAVYKGSYRVDFLVYYKAEGKRGQWLYVELDGKQHTSQPTQDGERAENLLIPEIRYDNLKLRYDGWFATLMRDIRAKAALGASWERDGRKRARQWRREFEAKMAERRAA